MSLSHTEDIVQAAYESGREATSRLGRDEQKRFGQFMTLPKIARFMARRLVAGTCGDVRILEPAAGTGVLAAAAVEALLDKPLEERPAVIELLMYEIDARLLAALEQTCARLAGRCEEAGVALKTRVELADFLASDLALNGQPIDGLLVIGNPPFFKLNKRDARAQLHPYAVHGQPNIYGLFMAACARLVPAGGRLCFITPRSWMNGSYFSAVRQTLLRHLMLDGIHAFESRQEGFEADAVLQETVITWATGRSAHCADPNIVLTRSTGALDLEQSELLDVRPERVVGGDAQAMLSLPRRHHDPFEGWTATLSTYGLQVSTGPVVAFRAARFLREAPGPQTVPLLWLQHVGQQRIQWPLRKKREHIQAVAENAWMLLPNRPLVVMRRFSPKEDARRITCAFYDGSLPGARIGLENHLNYIHRPGGPMSRDEARGLAAFLASRMVDDHFRALAGSTQVNAAELRRLPLPPLDVLVGIGAALPAHATLAEIDQAVDAALAHIAGAVAVAVAVAA